MYLKNGGRNLPLYWADLEIVYANALYEEKSKLDDQDVKRIEESLKNLHSLLESLLPRDKLEDVDLYSRDTIYFDP